MAEDVKDTIERMRGMADPSSRDGMARYGINTDRVLGLRMPQIRGLAKELGRDQELALALYDTGIHEARILAALVAEPKRVDGDLMDRWAAEFDSWDVCDQHCMNLYRRLPEAWDKVEQWTAREEEFVRRAGFALLASLAVHAKREPDERFVDLLPLIEAHSDDNRNFVKKAVNWALRQIGKRSHALNAHALDCAERIAARGTPAAKWIAADAIRELTDEKIRSRIKS